MMVAKKINLTFDLTIYVLPPNETDVASDLFDDYASESLDLEKNFWGVRLEAAQYTLRAMPHTNADFIYRRPET